MGGICSCFGTDRTKGLFSNSSGFVINGGVFNAASSASESPRTTGSNDITLQCSDSEVYARMLPNKKKGYPLWNPGVSDDLPSEYRKTGVSIGDVGTIDEDGGFQYFFNILLPANHPSNGGAQRVPTGFSPLSASRSLDLCTERRSNQYAPGTHIANPESDICKTQLEEFEMSREVKIALRIGKVPPEFGCGFQFDANSSEGAILVLPEGGIREDIQNEDIFYDYAARNAISWYAHINGVLGRRLGGNSLLLVTGVDKATAWGVAAFHQAEKGSVCLTMVPDTRTQSKYWFRSVHYAAALTGPPHNNLGDSGPTEDNDPNRCVFVRGIRVSVRPSVLPVAKKGGSRMSVKTHSLRNLPMRDLLSPSSYIPFKTRRSKNLEPFVFVDTDQVPSKSLVSVPDLFDSSTIP
ncbi:hypothetical protein Moror_9594 [Moniliophthora roreri MCA 2997]|uniref:Uncharacterized protein n=1 Tax=Moniliophthora roreri (strain MCA 2997) TaxID=1381753 RepID=V2WW30_MONRO|nr:hypothetical protein Moror_9594 [Moniliophthora roreri MCA 2997]